jgi:hypothetical protein
MSFLWIGSQIPLFLFGSVLPLIYNDIGGVDRWVWFVIGYLIPNAALCPFVGALSDLFGRQKVAIVGQVCLIVGPIITATANTMNIAIGKLQEVQSANQANRSSWQRLFWNRRWSQRAHRPCRNSRSCARQGPWQVRWSGCHHHFALLPLRIVGSAHCSSQQLALQRYPCRRLELHRSPPVHLLLP